MEECPASLLFMSQDESRQLALDPDLFVRVGGGVVDLLDTHVVHGLQGLTEDRFAKEQQQQQHRQYHQLLHTIEGKIASSPSTFTATGALEPATLLSSTQSVGKQLGLDPRVALTIEEANASATNAATELSTTTKIAVADDADPSDHFFCAGVEEHPSRLGTVLVDLSLPELGTQSQSILETCCLIESLQEAHPLLSSSSNARASVASSHSVFADDGSVRDDNRTWAETWRAAGKPTSDDGVTEGDESKRRRGAGRGGEQGDSRVTAMLAWESFRDIVPARLPGISPFVSESSASVFSALYQRHKKDAFSLDTSSQIVPHQSLIQQTFLLIQGTPSSLFSYNAANQVFEMTKDRVRIVGCSEHSISRLFEQFLATGTHMRRLTHVADICIHHPEGMALVRIAFGRALWSYLSMLQRTMLDMQDGWRNDVGDRAGILELHECTRDMAVTLEQLATLCCCHISQNMDEAHVSPYGFYLPHGAGLLTLLFDHIDKTPCVDSLWSALLTSILEQTSQPYCDMLSRWLGITPESNHYESTGGVAASTTAPRTRDAPTTFQFGDHIHRHLQGLDSFSEFFVQSKSEWVFEGSHPLLLPDGHYELSNGFDELAREGSGLKSWDGEFQLNPLCPPAAFITGDLAQKVLEAGKALQMMLEYDAQHPLSFSSGTPPFRWVFSQKELRDDRQQREVQRRVVMSRMVDRLRSKGVLTDKLQSMDLDPSNHGAPISPGDDGRMHVELPGLLHTNTLEFPGSEALDMAWNPFGHRGELGAFFNYSTYPDETSVAAKDKSCIHTMETLLSTANAQDENVQLHQQQEYALLPMVVLAQECISYPLQAHAELIDTCFVSFFIHDLHLLDHWRIMGRFMLMRDGIFVTLLSEALFDDESGFIQQQLTKASERGHLRSRSGHKMDVPWPPRSGELEAALRMVLLDAFQSTDSASSLQADVLDETLAFAVKDYSEDVAICRDVHAMEAFDFLYLEYRSPGPVQMLILQPHVMEKYTRLFTFHLRLLRVHASMRQCFRHLKTLSRISLDAKGDRRPKRRLPGLQVKDLQCLQQFRFEAEQVLEGLRGYLFDTAVGVNWSQFMQRMEAIKSRVEARLIVEGAANAGPMHRATTPLHTLQHQAGDPRSAKGGDGDETSGRDDDDDFDCTNGSMDSISAIREAHEQMLEQILVQALLKRKQRPVLKVVHEVLGCMVQLCKNVRELLQILEVAANVQGDDWSDDEQMESEEGEDRDEVEQGVAVQEIMQRVQAQYERFRSTCTMLARVLKALDGSMAAGSSSASAQMHGEKQASFLQQLLVRLGWMSERDVAK